MIVFSPSVWLLPACFPSVLSTRVLSRLIHVKLSVHLLSPSDLLTPPRFTQRAASSSSSSSSSFAPSILRLSITVARQSRKLVTISITNQHACTLSSEPRLQSLIFRFLLPRSAFFSCVNRLCMSESESAPQQHEAKALFVLYVRVSERLCRPRPAGFCAFTSVGF